MKTNIKNILIGCAIIMSSTACSDFLGSDADSKSELTPDVVYESITYSGQALNKVYAGLVLDHTYGARLPLNFSLNSDIELVDALGESAVTEPNERGLGNYNPTPGWGRLDDNWKALFAIIEDANSVIEGLRNSSLIKDGNEHQKKALSYLGEALTLRAMVYYDLAKNYGDIPMKFEPTRPDGSNIYLPKTDRDVILDQLLLDLDEAASYLPWVGEMSYTSEQITAGFARGLYARVALSRAGWAIREQAKPDYETAANSDSKYPTQRPDGSVRTKLYKDALAQLDQILIKGTHKLNPSFSDFWSKTNKLELDRVHNESLYEVAHGLGYSGEMGYTVGVRISGPSAYYGPKGNSSGKVKLTAPFFMSYDKNDLRRDITCATYELKDDAGKIKENMQKNAPFSIYVAKWDVRKMSDAWLSIARASSDKVGYGVNWITMRYSDVLLMYAEIVNELEGPNGAGTSGVTAKDALLQVRARAFDSSKLGEVEAYVNGLNAKEDFFKAVVDERAWELAGEGIRKYDLIRWNLLIDKTKEMKDTYTNDVIVNAPHTLYYKINDDFTIDMSSISWYELLFNSDTDAKAQGYVSVAGWGTKIDKDKNSNEENLERLPFINVGLTGEVKNRHLIPLGSKTISDSNGMLENSYGFK